MTLATQSLGKSVHVYSKLSANRIYTMNIISLLHKQSF